jgi:2-dehydropantoate 2-reductase
MKNVLIVGTGALATMFAARLSASGADVTVLGTWLDALAALNRDGALLLLPDGGRMISRVRATQDPAECSNAGLALVLVKAWQTERAARQLAQCLALNGLALTLQNGLGNREILAEVLGLERIMLGITTTGATLLAPGAARMGGEGLISLELHPRGAEIRDLLTHAGFQNEVAPDAESLVWGKLVVNAAINPLTALLSVPNGAILERPEARALAAALANETAAVALSLGVCLPFMNPVSAVEDVLRATAANRSSMFQDVLRGAPTEIDAICGAVVRAGESRGVPTPLNWTMWQLVSALQSG